MQVCPVDLCSVHLWYRTDGSGMERELITVKHSEMFSKDFEHTFNGNKAF